MNGYRYILSKQIEWARNRGAKLTGKKGAHGLPAYTAHLEENLFKPLMPEVRDSFAAGDGDELGSPGVPGKMQAVHSSSALCVNVFQYWKSISAVPVIAAACGLCKRGSTVSYDIRFEEKYPIDENFALHPNIDVVIHNQPGAKIRSFAVECKFSEAYANYQHGGLKEKYLQCADIWDGLPNLRRLAETISPTDQEYKHLHPAQLIKHILGLKRAFGVNGFRLLYLWYNVLGEEGVRHREEILGFAQFAKSDGIMFHSLSYQELISRLAANLRAEHKAYIRYLTERYL